MVREADSACRAHGCGSKSMKGRDETWQDRLVPSTGGPWGCRTGRHLRVSSRSTCKSAGSVRSTCCSTRRGGCSRTPGCRWSSTRARLRNRVSTPARPVAELLRRHPGLVHVVAHFGMSEYHPFADLAEASPGATSPTSVPLRASARGPRRFGLGDDWMRAVLWVSGIRLLGGCPRSASAEHRKAGRLSRLGDQPDIRDEEGRNRRHRQ